MKNFCVLILCLIILLLIASCSLFTYPGYTTGLIVGRIILPEGIDHTISQIYLYIEDNPHYLQNIVPNEPSFIEDLEKGKSYTLIATTRPIGVINSRTHGEDFFSARLEDLVAETGEGKKLGRVLLRKTGIIQGTVELYDQEVNYTSFSA